MQQTHAPTWLPVPRGKHHPTPASHRGRGGLALVLALLTGFPIVAGEMKYTEYQAKARFLTLCAEFVEWPTNAFPNSSAPILIGVLGDDPFGSDLEDAVKLVTIKNRPLVVRRSRRLEDLKSCHLLFISQSEKGRLRPILDSLEGMSILTVSEIDRFATRGGMIRIYLESKKPNYKINPASIRRSGLKVDSQLLTEDKVVPDESLPKK